jgi:hypothetical protein
LPFDLDALAEETGALKRRRNVKNGERLFRAFCLYGLPNSSFQLAAAQAAKLNICEMTPSALFTRFKRAGPFLASIFKHLMRRASGRAETWGGFKLVAVDATVLCGPGAKGTNQRLHTAYDLGAGCPLHVDVTGAEGGETFRRYLGLGPGVLVLADQGYGHGPGIVPLLQSGAHVLVRFNFYSIRLLDSDGAKITPERAEGMLEAEGTIEFEATLPGWDRSVRVFGTRNPEGEGIWLLTDLPESKLAKDQVRGLYSRRWQIENFFKRMKSLLDLDQLPTRDGPTARPWVWLKLVLTALAVLIGHERFSPWGVPEGPEAEETNQKQNRAHVTRRRGRPRKSAVPERTT